jgi:hypothetical protein
MRLGGQAEREYVLSLTEDAVLGKEATAIAKRAKKRSGA